MESFDAFRKQVQRHQKDLETAQSSVLYAQKLISKELDIGPGQCTRIVNSIRSAEEPLRDFYALLETPEMLPLPTRSIRHPLLIILNNTRNLLQDLICDISSLSVTYRTSSQQEAYFYQQSILRRLDNFSQKKEDIVQDIDRLLLSAHAHR